MKIILSNGTELQPTTVTGVLKFLQGYNRDCLNFVFDDTMSLDEIDSLFTEENCESITIVGDDNSESIYNGYTIRAELKKADATVAPATPDSEETTVKRITVSMAQRTYSENQIKKQAEQISSLEDCLIEVGQVIYA